MEVNINRVDSTVEMHDSKSLLDPRILSRIKMECAQAHQESETRRKFLASERRLNSNQLEEDEE
jgi:hypothetical protein